MYTMQTNVTIFVREKSPFEVRWAKQPVAKTIQLLGANSSKKGFA